jgi:hypothetical protein
MLRAERRQLTDESWLTRCIAKHNLNRVNFTQLAASDCWRGLSGVDPSKSTDLSTVIVDK